MEEQTLVDYINLNYSTYQIANAVNKSQTAIRFWLKKYDLKTTHLSFKDRKRSNIILLNKCCPKCKMVKESSEFYQRRDKTNLTPYCKSCTNLQASERSQVFKEKCIEYKGNSCSICGYNKYIGALEFHHLDPTQKDFSISNVRAWRFDNKIKQELDKCIVLCSNCHREIHFELRISGRP